MVAELLVHGRQFFRRGMLGIFIVTAIIIVCITILNRVTGKNDNNEDLLKKERNKERNGKINNNSVKNRDKNQIFTTITGNYR